MAACKLASGDLGTKVVDIQRLDFAVIQVVDKLADQLMGVDRVVWAYEQDFDMELVGMFAGGSTSGYRGHIQADLDTLALEDDAVVVAGIAVGEENIHVAHIAAIGELEEVGTTDVEDFDIHVAWCVVIEIRWRFAVLDV